MHNRRVHQRFDCDLRARVVLDDGAQLDARTSDISFSGICVHVDAPVATRTRAKFHVWVSLPDRNTKEIVLPGRIVWSTPVEGAQQLGATFDRNIDNRAVTRLELLLQYLAGKAGQPDRR